MNVLSWGMAEGDLYGDGKSEFLLLARDSVKIGRLTDSGFETESFCNLPGLAKGSRVYTYDLDQDGRDEIIVSAVEGGMPASVAFNFKDKTCSILFERARYSLRVVRNLDGKNVLLGQGSGQGAFFFGPIYEMSLEGGRLKPVTKYEVPRYTNIYQFTELPPNGETARFAVVKGWNPIEVHEKRRNSFKKTWRSGERFGGTINILGAEERDVLGEVAANHVDFDVSPVASGGDFRLYVVRHTMPLRGVIGKRPMVGGAEVVEFSWDPSLGFMEKSRTVKLPGAIVDVFMGHGLFVLMQGEVGMFHEGESSTILTFEM